MESTRAAVHGIHHLTAIAGDPQENLDFYTHVLGLRLVKKSINQDVTDTYHLFFADAEGTPGTDITFFPWPQMAPARNGAGMVGEVAFAVPPGSLEYWKDRLQTHGVAMDGEERRFGETVLPFADPHGLRLAVVETRGERPFVAWPKSPVPEAHQLRGMYGVRTQARQLEPTELLLTKILGFEKIGEENGWHRYGVDGGGPGTLIEVNVRAEAAPGRWGTGGVHHVAWRVRDAEEEQALRHILTQVGLSPSPVIDRFWFESVYFREPGGVLFELATDGPGFDRDEQMDALGTTLVLPPWLEGQRRQIEAALPPLRMPDYENERA